MKKLFCLMAAGLCLTTMALAQERSAVGAMDTQMTWSSLSSQIGGLRNDVTGLDSKLAQAVTCGKNNKLYAPGAPGADGNGCKEVDLTTNAQFSNLVTNVNNLTKTVATNNTTAATAVNSIKVCGQSGWVYSPGTAGADSNGCVKTTTGRPCVMDSAAACGKAGACVIRSRYPFGRGETNTTVPTNWKDGDSYFWKYATTKNDYGGGQCKDGTITYFAVAN